MKLSIAFAPVAALTVLTAMASFAADIPASDPLRSQTVAPTTSAKSQRELTAAANPVDGLWFGVIEGYTSGEPRRTLAVTSRDKGLVCTWDEVGRTKDFPAVCEANGNALTLMTGARSTISLAQEGASLKGTFTLRNGQSFPILMGRTPVLDTDLRLAAAVGSQGGSFPEFAGKTCKGRYEFVIGGQNDTARAAMWFQPDGNGQFIFWRNFGREAMVNYDKVSSHAGYSPFGTTQLHRKGAKVGFTGSNGIVYTMTPTASPGTYDLYMTWDNGDGPWFGVVKCVKASK